MGKPHFLSNTMRHSKQTKIVLLDTSIASKNLGDQIIMDSVRRQMRKILPGAFFVTVPTHDILGSTSRKLIEDADLSIVGGTNLLSSNFNEYNQWKIWFRDYFSLRKIILLGVGWWQYQGSPNFYTRRLLNRVLCKNRLHSVRDSYTAEQLLNAGINNFLNTGCTTMWDLTEDFVVDIPTEKAEEVICTVTDYNPDPRADQALISALKRNYSKIWLWLQGSGDFTYARQNLDRTLHYVDPSLDAYDELLCSSRSLDYFGTRLHAGLRALQHKRRSLIVAVDNRATEMGSDFGLPVVRRQDIEKIGPEIINSRQTLIELPKREIEKWKLQFDDIKNLDM